MNRVWTIKYQLIKGRPGTSKVNVHIPQVTEMTDTWLSGHSGVLPAGSYQSFLVPVGYGHIQIAGARPVFFSQYVSVNCV